MTLILPIRVEEGLPFQGNGRECFSSVWMDVNSCWQPSWHRVGNQPENQVYTEMGRAKRNCREAEPEPTAPGVLFLGF